MGVRYFPPIGLPSASLCLFHTDLSEFSNELAKGARQWAMGVVDKNA